jgi:hypothetical protein
MSGQKQRTTFAKQQRERARMEKAAEKRKRREERKLGEGFGPDDGHVPYILDLNGLPIDPETGAPLPLDVLRVDGAEPVNDAARGVE